MKMNELLFLATFIWAGSASLAHAYVDPGSGSIIVTTILGFFAAITYTFRKYFYKLKRKFFGAGAESEDRSLGD